MQPLASCGSSNPTASGGIHCAHSHYVTQANHNHLMIAQHMLQLSRHSFGRALATSEQREKNAITSTTGPSKCSDLNECFLNIAFLVRTWLALTNGRASQVSTRRNYIRDRIDEFQLPDDRPLLSAQFAALVRTRHALLTR